GFGTQHAGEILFAPGITLDDRHAAHCSARSAIVQGRHNSPRFFCLAPQSRPRYGAIRGCNRASKGPRGPLPKATRRTDMKPSYTTIIASAGLAALVASGTANAAQDPSRPSEKEEAIGVFSGMAIGAV